MKLNPCKLNSDKNRGLRFEENHFLHMNVYIYALIYYTWVKNSIYLYFKYLDQINSYRHTHEILPYRPLFGRRISITEKYSIWPSKWAIGGVFYDVAILSYRELGYIVKYSPIAHCSLTEKYSIPPTKMGDRGAFHDIVVLSRIGLYREILRYRPSVRYSL